MAGNRGSDASGGCQEGQRGERGFLGSSDSSFTTFVTPKIIKVLYILITIWTALVALIVLIIGFRTGGLAGGLFTLIIVEPIMILLTLGVYRVVLEALRGWCCGSTRRRRRSARGQKARV